MKVKEITLENAVVQHRLTFTKEDIRDGIEMLLGMGLLLLGTSFLAVILYGLAK